MNFINFLDLRNIGLFFDHFGLVVWVFIICVSIRDLKKEKLNPNINERYLKRILLVIGILGLIVDGGMVFGFYVVK
jgi:hypothetical protein